jgi:hypothetical protein
MHFSVILFFLIQFYFKITENQQFLEIFSYLYNFEHFSMNKC